MKYEEGNVKLHLVDGSWLVYTNGEYRGKLTYTGFDLMDVEHYMADDGLARYVGDGLNCSFQQAVVRLRQKSMTDDFRIGIEQTAYRVSYKGKKVGEIVPYFQEPHVWITSKAMSEWLGIKYEGTPDEVIELVYERYAELLALGEIPHDTAS